MNRKTRGAIFTITGGIFWGFSGSCGQYIFSNYDLNSAWLTAVRMLGAGIILTILNLTCDREKNLRIWKDKKDAASQIVFALLGLMFCQYAYLTAIAFSNAGTATVLQYLGPVLIMITVCIMKRKLPGKKEVLAIGLAVTGTFLLATHGNPRTMVLTPMGLLWGLLAAVSVVLYTMLPERIIKKYGSMCVTGYGMLIGGAVMACAIRIWEIPAELDLKGWLAVGGVVIVGTLVAYTMYLQGVADVGPVKASMLASVEPVSATLLSVLWLHSVFTPVDLAGFLCIMTTIFLLIKKENKDETASND